MSKRGKRQLTSEEKLDNWREEMQPRMARLQAFELPEDFPFDYSRASLVALEAELLDRFPPGSEPRIERGGFVEAAMSYLGETLLTLCGGRWGWDDDATSASHDTPLACPDDRLGLPPLAPGRLLAEAAARRTGQELVRRYDALVGAIDQARGEDPSFSPVKERTPGLDEILDPAPSEFLIEWLKERQLAFGGWVERYGADLGPWDFSPESLDALETVVCQALTCEGDFDEPTNHELVEGAVWYYGEVAQLAKNATWRHNRGAPDPHNPYVGRPYVKRTVRDSHARVPIFTLQNAVDLARPGYLREGFDAFDW